MIAALFAAVGLQAAPSPDPHAAFAAWRVGDLGAAAGHAHEAMARLEAEECSISEDGARLAFILGVAAEFDLIDDPAPYWFWTAGRVARTAGGLDRDQRRAADRLSGEPGRDAALDAWFAGSRYLGRGLRSDECGPGGGPLIDPAPGAGPAAYLLLELRTGYGTRVRDARLVLAYPWAEGDGLRDRVVGRHLVTGAVERTPRRFTFDPCETFRDEHAAPVEVCR